MKTDNLAALRAGRNWFGAGSCSLEELQQHLDRRLSTEDVPLAATIEQNVPIYDCAALRRIAADPSGRREIMAEWVANLRDGSGIVVLAGAFADPAPVDTATAAFERIIAAQRAAGTQSGDHFAKPGANDRIWNALEKLCLEDPETFARYYGNDMIALVSEAWLGPCYQMTSQLNVVNPGGAAQTAHRDYHLGFQSAAVVERYPAHVHLFSPMLTLQGAVAHCDMPVESGPTCYLPFSQSYAPGYLAAQDPAIRDWFAGNHVQLPLRKGDAAFFNPALLHAAGHNRSSDIRRMANLLQVSSAYGRAMESIDRQRMSAALFPVLGRLGAEGTLDAAAIDNVVAASAEGYSFPTNLDSDPPVGGLAPESQQELMRRALAEGWAADRFVDALAAQASRRLP
ncbi:phytanoyl-CoA dioxygenase family protein [Rhizosaccharibacter radicis]|uniref:Phytanoyl-CoA dioxygenase family protein n=1 Tax=Rhizosaccharibacter radicis TaxID=2782605 RepID=A0ABT1VYL2_9PROT|nr:phytanoyl-CoA dioxygenase family protein [Acetobacteraceae bacterium KSS12]